MNKTVCELFAGVGGFRLGFEKLKSDWKTVWFSQWEPNAKKQWAHECYIKHFGDCLDINDEYHTNEDISNINKHTIPNHTLLTAGFPCQDYSVAKALSNSKGIEGKKGVLWWQIYETIKAKKPPFCLFENVDRLIKSPSPQKGRDFGIILSCLYKLGYCAEWRVVNSANYGSAQRRKRTFIFAWHNDTKYAYKMFNLNEQEIISTDGLMARAFPIYNVDLYKTTYIHKDIEHTSKYFTFDFENAGCLLGNKITTMKADSLTEAPIVLGDILQKDVPEKYYIKDEKLSRWHYLKEAKKIPRTSSSGFDYIYSEGAVAFPDYLDKPARTIVTGEGTISRSSHTVLDPQTNRLRTLTPIEVERLQGFPDNWTNTGMSERMRYFCIGNALVVSMVTKMAKVLTEIIDKE